MTGSPTSEAIKYKGRATDFHNLFAAQSSTNGSRGNKNYGTADSTKVGYIDRTIDNGLMAIAMMPLILNQEIKIRVA